MTKYIGMACAALMAMLTLSVFTASAFAEEKIPDSYLCYKISEYKAKVKGGLYAAGCKELVKTLEGEWELAELLFKLPGTTNLWCALIKGVNTDGYYTTDKCEVKNSIENEHDWSDVVKEEGSEKALADEFTVETPFEASWGESKLNLSGVEIKCKKAVGNESEVVNKKLGKFLVPAEWHLVPPLGRIVFLLKETEIKCTAATIKVKEGSSVVGKIGQWGKKGTTFEVEVNAPENAKKEREQEYTEYENNEGKLVKAELKIESGKKVMPATQEDAKATITTTKATELVS